MTRVTKPGECTTTGTVTIDCEVLRAVFDTAVHSMDFGSGFLDDEEVQALRACAIVLGVEPRIATPRNFVCKYEHGGEHDAKPSGTGLWCSRCHTHLPKPEQRT